MGARFLVWHVVVNELLLVWLLKSTAALLLVPRQLLCTHRVCRRRRLSTYQLCPLGSSHWEGAQAVIVRIRSAGELSQPGLPTGLTLKGCWRLRLLEYQLCPLGSSPWEGACRLHEQVHPLPIWHSPKEEAACTWQSSTDVQGHCMPHVASTMHATPVQTSPAGLPFQQMHAVTDTSATSAKSRKPRPVQPAGMQCSREE